MSRHAKMTFYATCAVTGLIVGLVHWDQKKTHERMIQPVIDLHRAQGTAVGDAYHDPEAAARRQKNVAELEAQRELESFLRQREQQGTQPGGASAALAAEEAALAARAAVASTVPLPSSPSPPAEPPAASSSSPPSATA
ncbi:hypothetical protein H696_04545 [Fonticula alba]|uniref:Uncharacterized protein n=1 Tax=Fonticula alba TaxID=691883 RepID=A0A058Z4D6_FONAL|nr:hypothetical protein H696_04545 [Fonticula alba]KCV69130.1 hypothetical protein H696_04545 [Fonticula alba]|eukprot:XP_009496701.1 hypothetical protein H696_04545 [Fonticula alba]